MLCDELKGGFLTRDGVLIRTELGAAAVTPTWYKKVADKYNDTNLTFHSVVLDDAWGEWFLESKAIPLVVTFRPLTGINVKKC